MQREAPLGPLSYLKNPLFFGCMHLPLIRAGEDSVTIIQLSFDAQHTTDGRIHDLRRSGRAKSEANWPMSGLVELSCEFKSTTRRSQFEGSKEYLSPLLRSECASSVNVMSVLLTNRGKKVVATRFRDRSTQVKCSFFRVSLRTS